MNIKTKWENESYYSVKMTEIVMDIFSFLTFFHITVIF